MIGAEHDGSVHSARGCMTSSYHWARHGSYCIFLEKSSTSRGNNEHSSVLARTVLDSSWATCMNWPQKQAETAFSLLISCLHDLMAQQRGMSRSFYCPEGLFCLSYLDLRPQYGDNESPEVARDYRGHNEFSWGYHSG